jgi:hypothetical protein
MTGPRRPDWRGPLFGAIPLGTPQALLLRQPPPQSDNGYDANHDEQADKSIATDHC